MSRWVYGPNAANPYNQAVYFGTAWQDGQSFNIQYVSEGNFASGGVVTDSVTIAGVNVPGMSVEVADNVGPALNNQGYDGIIGLGIGASTVGPNPSPTFVQMIQGGLDNPIFAVNLKNDDTGVLDLGDLDTSAFVGDLASAPVDSSTGYWQLDGVTFDFGDAFSQGMIVDTGSVATTVDPSIAAGYWSQVPGAVDTSAAQDGSAWEFPCGTGLPDFNMYVNGWTVTLPGGSLAWSPDANNAAMCQGGLQGGSGTGSMGGPFFLAYYVVFNTADPSLQWAPQA